MKKYFVSLIFLIAINTAAAQLPVFQWAKAFVAYNQSNPSVYSNGRSVAVDQMGNVYSAGLFNHTTDFDPGPGLFTLSADNWANTAIYISKLSASGDFLWAIQIPTYVEFGNIEIRVDKDNNVYIASELRLPSDFDPGPGVYILSPTGGWDAFVAKYDPNGNLVWAKQFGGSGDTVPRSDVLEIDNDNNVIVCGSFNNTVDFDPGPAGYGVTSTSGTQAFIVKLNSNGNFIWAKQFGSGCHIADVKCDLQGNIYATGDFAGYWDFDPGSANSPLQNQGLKDGYVAKLTPNGNYIWAKSIGNTTNDFYEFTDTRGIDVDANHNVYITGNFTGTFDFDPGPGTHIISSSNYDWYLLKLNSKGDFVWVDVFGGSEGDIGADVVAGNDGNIYTIGTIGAVADMDPGPGVYTITTITQYGASALVKVNSIGGFITAASFDQIGSDYGTCLTRRIVVDNLQNIYITGYVAGSIDFDPGPDVYPLSSGGTEAPFVLKLAKCTNITTSTLNISTCNSFTLNNETFDSTGTYVRTVRNSTGCDSIITLHLTINKKYTEQTKTICEGESFFAGGANQTVSGIYKDTLTTSLNCDSIVTTRLTVNPKPLPMLGPDQDLCAGSQLIISPGSFTQYLWHDMTTSNSLTVNTSGLYWVKVTNVFNCTAIDSIVIRSILPSPNSFLKKTDSICSYQTLAIASTGIFNQYLWSTGAAEKQIIIDKPGTYWLKVTDANGCTGTNSISIYPKDCMRGVFIPTAFTPNNDGLNDVFKALVFGKIMSFKLQVFSREGQLIFQTTDPLKGWDGSYKGRSYSTTAFVWQCSYQLENRQPEYQKGTVIIIR
jgi:gliding motility-associated-like protein